MIMMITMFLRVVGIMVSYDYVVHECLQDGNKEAKSRNWEDFASKNREKALALRYCFHGKSNISDS